MKREKFELLQKDIERSIGWMSDDIFNLEKRYLKIAKKEFETTEAKGVRHYIQGQRELCFAIIRRLKSKMEVVIHDWYIEDKGYYPPFICPDCGRDTREVKDGSNAA